jgi:hypothetical protein
MEMELKQQRQHSSSSSARLVRLTLCGALWALLSGCDNRRDILDDMGVWVPLSVDWRQAGIRPEGVSIYVFDGETGEQVTKLLTNEVSSDSITVDSVKLHAGRYSLLVFNETVDSHDNISFRGADCYRTFEAYAMPVSAPAVSRHTPQSAEALASTPAAAASPNALAVAHWDLLEVGYDMIRSQTCPQLPLAPQKLSVEVEVTVHLKNMQYLSPREQTGALSSMAEGIFLATGAPSAAPITHYFTLNNRDLSDQSSEGTLKAAFAAFGVASAPEAAGNVLSMWFTLRDGEVYAIQRSVTSQLRNGKTGMEVFLKVEVGLGLTSEDPAIALPYAPDAEGMFDVGIGGWEENDENVVIPTG